MVYTLIVRDTNTIPLQNSQTDVEVPFCSDECRLAYTKDLSLPQTPNRSPRKATRDVHKGDTACVWCLEDLT